MRMKFLLLAILFFSCSGGIVCATPAQKSAAAALTGRVSSEAEGMMEGVLVRAKGEGKTISVTVVTDHAGRYSFPADRLSPGKFNIDIRAVGYDLANPASVDIVEGKTSKADLKLMKTND